MTLDPQNEKKKEKIFRNKLWLTDLHITQNRRKCYSNDDAYLLGLVFIFKWAMAIFILHKALPLENLCETFQGAPRPGHGANRPLALWPLFNSRSDPVLARLRDI